MRTQRNAICFLVGFVIPFALVGVLALVGIR